MPAARRQPKQAVSQVKTKPRPEPKAKPALTIVQALDDEALFKPYFRGPSWDGWRTILKAAFAIPLNDSELEFFHTVAGDRDPPERQVREFWCIAGRRGGKDSVASVIAAYSAALFTGQKHLRPGERALVTCLACDRDQSRIVLNYTRSYFSDIPMLAALSSRNTAIGFELKNGVDVAISTNSFRSVRGRPVVCAIFDEVAFWRDETSSKPDEETLKAIIPALASIPNSMVIGISTPYRKSGLLYRKYKQHYGQSGDILVIKAPTRLLNPTIPQDVVDRALEEDFAAAQAEWMAEFRSDIAGYLDLEVIESAVDGVTVRPPLSKVKYWSFCDPSGGARDSFTAAIAHNEDGIAVLDCLIEVRAPFNPSSATAEIAAVLKTYALTETIGDRYAAQWVVDAFAQCGLTYKHSERDRSAIYSDCLPLFTSGKARILANKRLVSQFASLERRTSPIGKDRIDHGPGGRDDLCNAAAGAMVLAAAPAFRAPQPQFGVQSTSAPASKIGGWAGNGGGAPYTSAPQDFWRMIGDIGSPK
jgi:hypothetical protein